jgi:hypothetical protein
MLSSLNSPRDNHNDHLRNLLDQRTARADLHGRFPSISEFSDTPSVYSHPFFSPRPFETSQTASHTGHDKLFSSSRSPVSDRDLLNDPSASTLDFGDDPRASFCSKDSYDDENHLVDPEDDDSTTRMSLLGPKMRFHSRAPWELDDDTLLEEEESDNSASYISSTFGGRLTPGMSSVAGGIRKGFGLGYPNSRSSNASRPSGESTRSQGKSKGSFESTSSQGSNPYGVPLPLAQASSSSTSLVLPPTHPQSSLKSKFTIGRAPSHDVSSTNNSSSLRVRDALHSHLTTNSSTSRRESSPTGSHVLSRIDTNSSRPSTPSSASHEDEVHPYANPDLVLSYVRDPPPRSPLRIALTLPAVSRSDSSVTVTDTTTSSLSRQAISPDSSVASVGEPRTPIRTGFQGKEISSPMSIPGSPVRHDSGGKNGYQLGTSAWTGNSDPPNFSLISLEEARAQRIRSATANPVMSQKSGSNAPSARIVPFPEIDNRGRALGNLESDSPVGSIASRGRTRSISAGAKAKNALHTLVGSAGPRVDRRDSEPAVIYQPVQSAAPSKAVKHKKSGFMRIFNGRDKEKEKALPPPVPQLIEAYAPYNPYSTKTRSAPRRIPVPPLFPEDPLSENSSPPDSQSSSLGSGPASPKRLLPSLSINTLASSQASLDPHSVWVNNRMSMNITDKVWQHPMPNPPQSAPPNVSEFPALQLRPVSTIFSAQFGDHIVRGSLESTAEVDSDTNSLTGPETVSSPLTPGFSLRSDSQASNKGMMSVISEDDPSHIVRALQEQISQAKRAWQLQIWELEGQVRDLKTELDEMRKSENEKPFCGACGRGKVLAAQPHASDCVHDAKKAGIVNRPRVVRTGAAARFGNGN